MQKLDVDFPVPNYLLEEINEYLYWRENGKNKIMKWENIKYLMNLSTMNNGLTREQISIIKSKIETK